MNLSPVIFWDTDISTINFEKNARYVISKVVMYGTLNDWEAIKKYYGVEKIRKELLQEKDMDDKTLHFLSVIFDIPKEQFRCFNRKQYLQGHWIS